MPDEKDELTQTGMDFINEQVKGVRLPPKESLWGRVGRWFSSSTEPSSEQSFDPKSSKKEHQS